jgi:putative transposase
VLLPEFVYLKVAMLSGRWSNRVVNGFLESREELQEMFSRRYF